MGTMNVYAWKLSFIRGLISSMFHSADAFQWWIFVCVEIDLARCFASLGWISDAFLACYTYCLSSCSVFFDHQRKHCFQDRKWLFCCETAWVAWGWSSASDWQEDAKPVIVVDPAGLNEVLSELPKSFKLSGKYDSSVARDREAWGLGGTCVCVWPSLFLR